MRNLETILKDFPSLRKKIHRISGLSHFIFMYDLPGRCVDMQKLEKVLDKYLVDIIYDYENGKMCKYKIDGCKTATKNNILKELGYEKKKSCRLL